VTGDGATPLLSSTTLRQMSQKGTTMKLFQTYAALIQSKQQFDAEVQKHLRGGHLPKKIIDKLAELHAACWNLKGTPRVYYAQRDNGAWKFYTSEEMTSANRHDAAQKSWERNVQPYQKLVKDNRGGDRNKTESVTPHRAFVLKSFKLLSVADRKWVVKQLGL